MDRQNLKKAAEKYLESEKDEICCVYDRFAGFVDGAEWANKTMLDRVCSYLYARLNNGRKLTSKLIDDMRKAMEE